MTLRILQEQLIREERQVALQHEQACYPHIAEKDKTASWQRANRAFNALYRSIRPWVSDDAAKSGDSVSRKKEYDEAFSAWMEEFGDPDDPATQASIDRTVAYLNRKGA